MLGFEIKCLLNSRKCIDILTDVAQAFKYSRGHIVVIAGQRVVDVDIIEERNKIVFAITDVKSIEDCDCDGFALTSDIPYLYAFLATIAIEKLYVKHVLH